MDYVVVGVFALVYLGMMLGELPGLKLDRTGIALLGAIVLVATERLTLDEAWAAIDVATMAMLLGLMVVSAQFRLGGFYTAVTRRLGASEHAPRTLLALVIVTGGVLSAVLANDIVCLAMAPVLVEVCARRGQGRWHRAMPVPEVVTPRYDRWQTLKGLLVVAAVMAAFLFTGWPREVVALAAAGVLLVSSQMASREMLGLVDWHLLVLFAGLFIVNAAVAQSGVLGGVFMAFRMANLDVTHPAVLFGITAVLSNLVSNVPAVMLLLPVASHELAGPVLALASTLAGNLLIVGSIANLIVVDQARLLGVEIDWRTHARVGIPVTLATLVLAAAWLLLIAPGTSVL